MDEKKWYYYLHTNGDLIGKNLIVVNSDSSYFDSPFVKKVWCIDLENRLDAWNLVLEALALGCNVKRAKELVTTWKLTFEDMPQMLLHNPKPTPLQRKGISVFAKEILEMEEDDFWNKLENMNSAEEK